MARSKPHLIATTSDLFIKEAERELFAVAQSLGPRVTLDIEVQSGGLLLVNFSEATFVSHFRSALCAFRPVFIRHIHVVEESLTITEESASLLREEVRTLVKKVVAQKVRDLLPPSSKHQPVAVQVRKVASMLPISGGQLAAWIREDLSEGVTRDEFLSPIFSCSAVGRGIYCGFGDGVHNLSPRMGGVIHFDMSLFPVSRAGSKLAEALEVFSIPKVEKKLPGEIRAIDLGAAPGGWTAVLLEQGYAVDAVDPGDLHPSLAVHPLVRAVKMKAQDFKPSPRTYDLLTCDVNWDALETARAVESLAPSLKQGGLGIVTVKLNRGEARDRILSVCRVLSPEFEVRDIKLLFHNRREVTLLLEKS